MRNMFPDTERFAFLNKPRESGEESSAMAPPYLVNEFPGLRREEAKAVCADWRATYHERHTRPRLGLQQSS
ncbi:hypothetical protein [Gordonibacter sp. Marseille-P4307]|uniref:hypothetical protein n=1 Tax=Gordonibacter sp. Marseille-P4307 TaxID=2161815 RepID=UPI000F51C58A|nr:hypothetical protein [Gordonibacter sp. Marseille-P4307]